MDEEPLDIKERINNLLWTLLPPDVTLGRAEQIAVKLCAEVADEWGRYKDDKK